MSRYFVFVTVSLALILSAMSSTAVAVAFPVITSSFDTSLILAGWVLSIYQLVLTAAMPVAGKASDVFGRKNVFLFCLGLFSVGSLLCAIAPNIQLLILFRVIQAIGGGGFMPSAAGIVSDEFPKARQQAIGLFTSIFPIGQIIGPNLGGWLTTVFGWRYIFWFNMPLAAVILVGSTLLLHSEQRKESSIDLTGAGLFTGSIFAFMMALSQLGDIQTDISWALVGPLFVLSIILMFAFLRHEAKVPNPIIDPVVLQHRPFLAANIYNFVLGACYFGISSLAPLYAVSVYNMSVLASGLILTLKAIGMMFTSTVTSILLVRWGYRRPMLIGTAGIILTLVFLGLESPDISILGITVGGTVLVLAILGLAGAAMGMTAPAANNACIELMPHRVATITGIRGMFRQTGGAISISVATLTLQNIGDMARGFQIVFFGLAIIMLIIMPVIFLMPHRAEKIADPGEDVQQAVLTASTEKEIE